MGANEFLESYFFEKVKEENEVLPCKYKERTKK